MGANILETPVSWSLGVDRTVTVLTSQAQYFNKGLNAAITIKSIRILNRLHSLFGQYITVLPTPRLVF
jgi:hypothetical protein